METATEKSKIFIKNFLHETAELHFLKSKMINFYKKILYIQSIYREHTLAFKSRCEAMSDIWEKEKGLLINEIIMKKNKKKTALMKKLNIL